MSAAERTRCPRCGALLVTRRDGIFRWKACRRAVACGWTVFNHGTDPRDTQPGAVKEIYS